MQSINSYLKLAGGLISAFSFLLILPIRAKVLQLLWNMVFGELFEIREISFGIAFIITFALTYII